MKRIFNVPQNTTKQDAYNMFIKNNPSDEMLDFTPTEKQILEYPAESNFNSPKKKLSKKESADILLKKANNSEIDVLPLY